MELNERVRIFSEKLGSAMNFTFSKDGEMLCVDGASYFASSSDWMNGYWSDGSTWDHNRWQDRW